VWLPAVKASGIDFGVRVHDLRHPHASWLLAGGADLKGVMDRMGHAQIQASQKYLHTFPGTDQKNLDCGVWRFVAAFCDRSVSQTGPAPSCI
jgi:integrase